MNGADASAEYSHDELKIIALTKRALKILAQVLEDANPKVRQEIESQVREEIRPPELPSSLSPEERQRRDNAHEATIQAEIDRRIAERLPGGQTPDLPGLNATEEARVIGTLLPAIIAELAAANGIEPGIEVFLIDDSTIRYEPEQPNGSSVTGRAVSLAAARTVQLADDGDVVLGKLLRVDQNGNANVQTGGYVSLPSSDGAPLTIGHKIVGRRDGSGARGFIRTAAADDANGLLAARGIVIDSTESQAVIVRLGRAV